MDLVLRDLRDQRHHGADHMRRLERAPDRQLAPDLVERADALAGFQRRGMGAVIGDHLLDRHFRLVEGGIGQVLVADGPFEHMVVVFARAVRAGGLAGEVLADHRRIGVHRLERIDHHRQRLVFHHHLVDAVIGGVAVGGDHEGDFLVLEQHLAVRQHHLHVAGQRRHPGEVDGFQRLGGDHRQHARHFQRLLVVDRLYPRMGMRRAHEIAVQHARQLQVVDIIALALRKADVLDALALAAHAFEFGFALFPRGSHVVHSAASWNSTPLILAAACWIARTMFW